MPQGLRVLQIYLRMLGYVLCYIPSSELCEISRLANIDEAKEAHREEERPGNRG